MYEALRGCSAGSELLSKTIPFCADIDPAYPFPNAEFPYGLRNPWGRAPLLLDQEFVEESFIALHSISPNALGKLFHFIHGSNGDIADICSFLGKRQYDLWLNKAPKDKGNFRAPQLSQEAKAFLGWVIGPGFSHGENYLTATTPRELLGKELTERLSYREDITHLDVDDVDNEILEFQMLHLPRNETYDEYAKREWRILSRQLARNGVSTEEINGSIKKAFKLAKDGFAGIMRRNGRYALEHSVDTALLMSELGFNESDDIVSALHHDGPEDTEIWNRRKHRVHTTEDRNHIAGGYYTKMFNGRVASRVIFMSKDFILEETLPKDLIDPIKLAEKKIQRDQDFITKFVKAVDTEVFLYVLKLVDRYLNLMTMSFSDLQKGLRQVNETYALLDNIMQSLTRFDRVQTEAAKKILILQLSAFDALFANVDNKMSERANYGVSY